VDDSGDREARAFSVPIESERGSSVLNLKFSGLQIDSKIADPPDLGRIGYGSTLCSTGTE
jgi:hypothetical protein